MNLSPRRFNRFTHQADVMAAIYPGFHIVGDSSKSKINANIVHLIYRRPMLQVYDNYLKNCQYLMLKKKSEAKNTLDRNFQPEFVFSLPMITARIYKSHIVPEDCRLNFIVEEEDKQQQIDQKIEDMQLWSILDSALPSYFANGSMFLFFNQKTDGDIDIKFFNTKYCFPKFDDNGDLESVKVRYIYETEEFNPRTKEKVWRWYQYKFHKDVNVSYDNPIFDKAQTQIPKFKIEKTDKHNNGYVQGEWIKTSHDFESNDGESFLEGKLDALDCMNYLLSGLYSSTVTNLFPPLHAQNVTPDEIVDALRDLKDQNIQSPGSDIIITPTSESNLHFLEPSLNGTRNGYTFNEEFKRYIQQMFSTVLLDPENVAPHANSGRALESLYKPVVQYVNCRRPLLKKGICNFLKKVEPFTGLEKGTFDKAKKVWGSIFSDTIDDISKRISNIVQLYTSQMISLETALNSIAKDVGIENVPNELKKVDEDNKKRMEEGVAEQNLMNDMSGGSENEQNIQGNKNSK